MHDHLNVVIITVFHNFNTLSFVICCEEVFVVCESVFVFVCLCVCLCV